MANGFKKVIDRQMWVQVAPMPNAHVAGASLCCDLRNTAERNPFVYQLASATTVNRFNIITKGWYALTTGLGLAGTFGAGAGCVFAPSFSNKGTLAAGATTTSVVLSTALAAAVGVNMLANRGGSGDYGFKIKIINNSANGSGKTEERWIVGNTGGTTPTITLDAALSFTPASGDTYEILGGRGFFLGAGTMAAASWRSFDCATNTIASGGTTNLPATISTDFAAVALDERYVPYDRKPGEGFLIGAGTYNGGALGCLTATAIAASTITGQSSAGDAAVLANEYRNFQIRIVEDTATPTAVGQRRMIASHTAGPSAVYTIGAAWTVNPSATAKFVIENPNLILLRSSATTTVYTYNYSDATINNGTASIATNSWHATYFGVAPAVMAAGCVMFPSWGIRPDVAKNARHGMVHCFRGGAVTLDVLNIAGGTAGSWETAAVYDGSFSSFGSGTCGKYAPFGNEGRMGYLNIYTASAVSQILRYDVRNRVLTPFTPTDWLQTGTAAVGDRIAAYAAIDGTDLYPVLMLNAHLSTVVQELIVTV